MVGRLGALGATGDFSWTYDSTSNTYTVTDPAANYTVTVTAGAMDAGLATGGTPVAIASDGMLIWSDPSAFGAYYQASTGFNVSNPFATPGFVPSAAGGVPGMPGGARILPPGATPTQDVTFAYTPDLSAPLSIDQQRAVLSLRIAEAQAKLTKDEQALAAQKAKDAKKDEKGFLAWLDRNWGKATAVGVGVAGLALWLYLAEKVKDGESLSAQCERFVQSPSVSAGLSCAFCELTKVCPPPGSGGADGVGSDSCGAGAAALQIASINVAKNAESAEKLASSFEAACGKDSPSSKLVRAAANKRKTQLTVNTALLWGGVGLGALLLIAAAVRSRK
jgi:hypothetical protein